jgi:putative transposase
MPWRETSVLDERREFVRLALQEGANRRELCRRFGISPDAGYRWLTRWRAGDQDLADRSHRPANSPRRSGEEAEARVLAVRDAHPAWGARKIARVLRRGGVAPPAVSTVHAILQRHDRIVSPVGGARASTRFEKPAANQLWQMDFKGWVRLVDRSICHPLTIVDDHSRFALCLRACANQQGETVKALIENTFQRYGLPDAIYVDNGSPWGDASGGKWTRFGVWLLKLGVDVIHSRPYHPQGRGKNERFHRTLDQEVFAFERFADHAAAQRAFDRWRDVYNFDRPHEGIAYQTPADRYRPSPRPMPDKTPQADYDPGEIVRTVPATKDYVSFKGRLWKVPMAFRGERVAIRPKNNDGEYGVFFGSHLIAEIDLTASPTVRHLSEQP